MFNIMLLTSNPPPAIPTSPTHPSQSGITSDNVTLHIDGVLYLKIDDPYKASYGVEDAEYVHPVHTERRLS